MNTGSCLCGKVQFEIQGELEGIQLCHCSQCRKAQGSAFATNIPVNIRQFTLLSGQDYLRYYESSPGKSRYFCSICASPLFSKTTASAQVIRIRAGTLNGDLKTQPVFHIYYGSKANWFNLNDDLPKFDKGAIER